MIVVEEQTGVSEAPVFGGFHRMIPWTDLNVDTSYQRLLSEAKVGKIARIFDPEAFGELVIGQRPDGTYWVIDGQHRWKAMQKLGWTDQLVPCHVIPDMTPEREAKLYDLYNGNRGMPRITDQFKARVRYGDPEAMKIMSIVNEVGFEIFYGHGAPPRGQVGAVSALLRIYRFGKEGDLLKVLNVCNEAWPDSLSSVKGELLLGMHRFMARYRGQFTMAELIERMATTEPQTLLNRGRTLADVMQTTGSVGTSVAILQFYNRHRRVKRLPEWGGEGLEQSSERKVD